MIALRNVTRTYVTPAGPFTAVRDVSLDVAAGELLALVGKSGSGKSTLLNLITGIDRPTAGEIRVGEMSLTGSSERALTRWRAASAGVVFQFFQLLPTLTVLDNVTLPMDFFGVRPRRTRRQHALDLLAKAGVADQAAKLPAALSGGEQQRVAIARALANDPRVITADEPTGNLDSDTAAGVLALFRALANEGTTVVLATHERDITAVASRTITIRDGRVA